MRSRLLLFRDQLRSHPKVSEDYAAFKRRLAADYQTGRLGYTNAKTDFIVSTLNRAGH
ncbi:MAG TPA: hypothetical protein EYG09_01695 [Dehalococcoidia bacterium]|nr:hypothetical protein [Dehalococcoidia bacterium]